MTNCRRHPLTAGIILFFLFLFLPISLMYADEEKSERLYPYGGPTQKEIDSWGNPFTWTEFEKLFNEVYSDTNTAARWFKATDKGLIYENRLIPWKTPPRNERLWRPARLLPPIQDPDTPLEGMRIAIDPGHIGGKWAALEQRDNMISDKYRIQEGVSARIVAELLADRLRKMGATVMLTRTSSHPVSKLTQEYIAQKLSRINNVPLDEGIQKEAGRLLMRPVEINARAAKMRRFRPDIILCLHFDAPAAQPYQDQLHLIINGAYLPSELENPDLRFSLLGKLLSKTHEEEVAVSSAVAHAMAERLRLPAFQYTLPQPGVRAVPGEPYLWCRNLLANCLYSSPVIYTEPFNMSNELTARRLTMGDYEGTRTFGKTPYPSIYREYADSVAEGLKTYYLEKRPSQIPPSTPEGENNEAANILL